jgi:hypothetical protein
MPSPILGLLIFQVKDRRVGEIAEHRVWLARAVAAILPTRGDGGSDQVGKIAIIVVASTTVGVSDFTHPTSLVGLSCRWQLTSAAAPAWGSRGHHDRDAGRLRLAVLMLTRDQTDDVARHVRSTSDRCGMLHRNRRRSGPVPPHAAQH